MRFFIILFIILIMLFASNQNFLAGDNIKKEGSMAIVFDPQQGVPLEELLTSLLVQQEALIRLLMKKGIFSKEEFSEMMSVVNKELKPMGMKLPAPVEGR
jgi:hypothetical protein